ncbi:MAG TPA: hypothetical protein DIT05_12885 [Morganella sp. (in: Bacteria)]|nr:hypothetical protein [Morganella sp. (in: enterobacteria)]
MSYRVFTLIKKELQTLVQERQARLILIIPVLFQILFFPFAATISVDDASIAIFNQDNGSFSDEIIQRIISSPAFRHVRVVQSEQEVSDIMDSQDVLLTIQFPDNFSSRIAANQPTSMLLILDGRVLNHAQTAAGYIEQIFGAYQQELAGHSQETKDDIIVRHWYNPDLNYKWFIVPSLVALITTIGVLTVTALSLAREREQGTLDQLLVSPLNTLQLFVGKAVPAIIVALIQATVILIIGIFGYKIPFNGSLILFYITMLIYTLSLVGIGLLISVFCQSQQKAFIGVFSFILPAILLSGYISPIENMPEWLQYVTLVNPIRHFTEISRAIYLKGSDYWQLFFQIKYLFFIACTTSVVAYILFRKRIM